MDHPGGADHDLQHAAPNLWTLAAYMLVLTAATFVTLFIPWNRMTNLLFVLAIAFCKASIVVGFFMHYRYEKMWKYFLTIPPIVLAVVAVCALLPDIAIGTWVAGTFHP